MSKLEGFMNKFERAINNGADKATEFAKKHELDSKVEKAGRTIESGAKEAWGELKSFVSDDDKKNEEGKA